jgi:hypothetical protein
MDSISSQKYTAEDIKAYIGKTVMFEVEVEHSSSGEANVSDLDG